jgi:hypothetical protein
MQVVVKVGQRTDDRKMDIQTPSFTRRPNRGGTAIEGRNMNVRRKIVSTFAVVAFISVGACSKKEVPMPSMNDAKSPWTSRQPAPAIAPLPTLQSQAVPVAPPVQPAAPIQRNDSTPWDAAAPGSVAAFNQAVDRCNALQGNEYTVCRNKADAELATR